MRLPATIDFAIDIAPIGLVSIAQSRCGSLPQNKIEAVHIHSDVFQSLSRDAAPCHGQRVVGHGTLLGSHFCEKVSCSSIIARLRRAYQSCITYSYAYMVVREAMLSISTSPPLALFNDRDCSNHISFSALISPARTWPIPMVVLEPTPA
jgi:hypothetical protein